MWGRRQIGALLSSSFVGDRSQGGGSLGYDEHVLSGKVRCVVHAAEEVGGLVVSCSFVVSECPCGMHVGVRAVGMVKERNICHV